MKTKLFAMLFAAIGTWATSESRQQPEEATSNTVSADILTYGMPGDLSAVATSSDGPIKITDLMRRLRKNIEWDIYCLEVLNDGRKLFLMTFGQEIPETYHITKLFTKKQKERLIITALRPVMILPKSLGYKVTNIISEGDWFALASNPNVLNYLEPTAPSARILILASQASNGFDGDPFFLSQVYKESILKYCANEYFKYGVEN